MNKLLSLTLLLAVPISVFAQENQEIPTYTLTTAGLFFMIFAWSSILIWNIVCFTKILSKKK